MARIIAIDYGKKRTGLAVTDPQQIIATGLTTVASQDTIYFLKDYFKKEVIEKIVIGFPKNLDGTATDATELVNKFCRNLEKVFPEIPIIKMDERFTSKMAQQVILQTVHKKTDRQNKALVDEVSATIILQDYLTSMQQ